jgi:hypothetical protein
MTTVWIGLAIALYAEPVDLLKAVREQYQGLKSFSMVIEHHNSSGLFPGDFTQTLKWAKGNRFELLVSKPNQNQSDNRAPDYRSDGQDVVSIRSSGPPTSDPVAIPRGISPGWEVSGGVILSWLVDGPTGKMMIDPPKDFKAAWSFGPRSEWKKLKVRELVLTMKARLEAQSVSFFVDESKREVVGFEYDFGKQKGYALYRDQKLNPDLPKTLGERSR